ncbi:hypothetical protein QR98_0077560 [Sarcoptes scabiei]|uniref:F-box/LRR-repeat protein 15-like leucin rich repeat domain-containing protein n=1 Tax=Sarcoptes scabiei TaxID=52283 RepID=A0A132AE64_SARSC|nr:hypothetical protein QR98_0077560 [Sarcoptes scabiei]
MLNRILPTFKLNHLIIRNGSVTDQGLELILTRFASNLSQLELYGCNELTNSGLWSGLVPNLSLLAIQDCINISDDTLATLCQLLNSLKTLRFQAYHVTDIAMVYFSTSMLRQSLRILTLQHCWELTNQGVANVAHSLPNLTSLSLSGCSKITDDAIEVVAEQLRNLNVLDLSWCPRISDASLEFIACDLADSLKTLILDRIEIRDSFDLKVLMIVMHEIYFRRVARTKLSCFSEHTIQTKHLLNQSQQSYRLFIEIRNQ